jgi:polyribonucleotide nucleotidyltransferase
MDIKIDGITEEIMKVALEPGARRPPAHPRRNGKAMTAPRELSEFAPQIVTIKIPTDKIREVIGTGGKVIREICEVTGAKVDIEDDGTIKVSPPSMRSHRKKPQHDQGITEEPEIGKIYTMVKSSRPWTSARSSTSWARKDGLVHISELADHRVNKVEDVVQEGATVKVKVLEMDGRGKIRLSMRVVDQDTGEDISDRVGKRDKKAGGNGN